MKPLLSLNALIAVQLTLLLTACNPTEIGPQKPSATTVPIASPSSISSSTPTPLSTLEPTATSSPSSTASVPPLPTSNPSSAASTSLNLPNGSKLQVTLGNRFLEAKGQSIQLQAKLTDATGNELPLSSLKLIFSSSRPQDISVNDQGLLTAMVEQGFSDITVSIDGTELKSNQLVSVNSIENYSGGGSASSKTPPGEKLRIDARFEGLGMGEFSVNRITPPIYTGSQISFNSDIARDDAGNFVIVWDEFFPTSGGTSGIILGQRFGANGLPIGNKMIIEASASTSIAYLNPQVAMDSDGDFVVTWQSNDGDDEKYGLDIYARRYNQSGIAQDSSFIVSTPVTSHYVYNPSIASDSDGNFVISWLKINDQSEGSVLAAQYDSAGILINSEFQVNSSDLNLNLTTSNGIIAPQIAMNDDGDFVIAWQGDDGNESGILARRYDSSGLASDSEFIVNSNTSGQQGIPSIAMDAEGDFTICWYDYENTTSKYAADAILNFQRYNRTGTPQGQQTLVKEGIDYPLFQASGFNFGGAEITADDDGDFILTWNQLDTGNSTQKTFAHRFHADGDANGSEFIIQQQVSSAFIPKTHVALDNEGDFVVAWSNFYSSKYDTVRAARFNNLNQLQ